MGDYEDRKRKWEMIADPIGGSSCLDGTFLRWLGLDR